MWLHETRSSCIRMRNRFEFPKPDPYNLQKSQVGGVASTPQNSNAQRVEKKASWLARLDISMNPEFNWGTLPQRVRWEWLKQTPALMSASSLQTYADTCEHRDTLITYTHIHAHAKSVTFKKPLNFRLWYRCHWGRWSLPGIECMTQVTAPVPWAWWELQSCALGCEKRPTTVSCSSLCPEHLRQ